MEYSDAGFEEFQNLLRSNRETNRLLWRLRDNIYSALYYRVLGENPGKRHAGGLWLWIAWAVRKAFTPATQRPLPLDSGQHFHFHFLFCGTHSAHFDTLVPLLREAAAHPARRAVIVWNFGLTTDQENFLRKIGDVLVMRVPEIFPSVLVRRKLVALWRTVREVFRLQRQLRSTPHKYALSQRRSFVGESIFQFLLSGHLWKDLLRNEHEGAVFTTTESLYLCKALFDLARQRKMRAVHLCHGLRHAMHQVTRATDLCAFSEMDRRWFQSRVDADCTVRAIGNPRFESIRELVGEPRPRKAGAPFRLLFFSPGSPESPYTAEMINADMAVLAADAAVRAKFSVRIRPHPRQSLDHLAQTLREIGLHVDEVSRGTLAEDITWSDAAATTWSTALLEAAVSRRPCYWIDVGAKGFGGTEELEREGVGLSVRTAEEWAQAVDDLFSLQMRPPAVVTESTLEKLRVCLDSRVPWLKRLAFS